MFGWPMNQIPNGYANGNHSIYFFFRQCLEAMAMWMKVLKMNLWICCPATVLKLGLFQGIVLPNVSTQ